MTQKERNQQLYDMLSKYQIFVLPDPKIETFDPLPQFSMIDTSIKDKNKDDSNNKKSKTKTNSPNTFDSPSARGQGERTKGLSDLSQMFDAGNFKGNVNLFRHLNDIESKRISKKIMKSESVNVKKRKRGGKFGEIEIFEI